MCVMRCLLCVAVVCCLQLVVICFSLRSVVRSLFAVRCVLVVVCSCLFGVSCLLFVVRCA